MPPPPSTGPTGRAPGSFSTNLTPTTASSFAQRPQLRRVDTSSSDDSSPGPTISVAKRPQNAPAQSSPRLNSSTDASAISLQNFSRPSATLSKTPDMPSRTTSPLTLIGRTSTNDVPRTHGRKHSQSQGFFEPSLSSSSFLPSHLSPTSGAPPSSLSASQIAAQAAMQHQSQHIRQRSQTLPPDNHSPNGSRRPSRGPVSPPLLSLTEASGEKQNSFGNVSGQYYRNGLLGGGSTSAAATAASVVFSRSPGSSPKLAPSEIITSQAATAKPAKQDKMSKVKLFSRPGKISTKDAKERPAGSPSKFVTALQRGNSSTISFADSMASSASSMYSMANSSTSTIRQAEPEREQKEKEKKVNFLSRQKQKLSSKDDHHLPLSSAASNSRPVDPSAPSSLYSFNLPPSPGPTSTSFSKSMSGLDLRHGGRALREKKREERGGEVARESETSHGNEWPGPSSMSSAGGFSSFGPPSSSFGLGIHAEAHPDLAKFGLNNMTTDDAWPFLRAKLLIVFEGEDLRLPIEDFNRLVSLHLQRCIQKRTPNVIVEDLRDLLHIGFSSLEQTLRRTPDDRLIPQLVELWLFTFASVLPYMQAVFLPLDLEFSGKGPLMTAEKARDFWGALPLNHAENAASTVPATQLLEVRRIVLTSYRDTVILSRYDTLKTIFSRLSLESIYSSAHVNTEQLSSSPSSSGAGGRPGTAMSLDPAYASYSSQGTTLLSGTDSSGARSRAISNVSYGSNHSTAHGPSNIDASMMPPPPTRPFTPSSTHPTMLGSLGFSTTSREREAAAMQREANVEDSKYVTETVGRMLQCVSVLAGAGVVPGGSSAGDETAQARMEELCKILKLNWLGRGRTGRNRRGFVGTKVRREEVSVA